MKCLATHELNPVLKVQCRFTRSVYWRRFNGPLSNSSCTKLATSSLLWPSCRASEIMLTLQMVPRKATTVFSLLSVVVAVKSFLWKPFSSFKSFNVLQDAGHRSSALPPGHPARFALAMNNSEHHRCWTNNVNGIEEDNKGKGQKEDGRIKRMELKCIQRRTSTKIYEGRRRRWQQDKQTIINAIDWRLCRDRRAALVNYFCNESSKLICSSTPIRSRISFFLSLFPSFCSTKRMATKWLDFRLDRSFLPPSVPAAPWRSSGRAELSI